VGHVKGVSDMSSLAAWTNEQFDPRLSWPDIAWVKERWGGKLILKGIQDIEDAKHRVQHVVGRSGDMLVRVRLHLADRAEVGMLDSLLLTFRECREGLVVRTGRLHLHQQVADFSGVVPERSKPGEERGHGKRISGIHCRMKIV
jgi:hypothetical protein